MFGPLNVFRSLPEASSTHSATAQQSPQGSSMKSLCAVVGIGTTAVLHSVLKTSCDVISTDHSMYLTVISGRSEKSEDIQSI